MKAALVLGVALAAGFGPVVAARAEAPAEASKVEMRWGERIPLRDGVKLSATVYLPKGQAAPAPCIFTLTPYIAQSYHDRGVYFAAHGLPFLTVDVRGRGNSEGEFRPLIQEAKDGHDVVEWLAKQPYCNGKVSMWGGSYAGYNQWATAKEAPPHLATIVPVASPYPGADFPARNNIAYPYLMQWLTFTDGKASQANIFGDAAFWASIARERFEEGEAFSTLPRIFGGEHKTLVEWISHAAVDAWYDSYAPTPEQFRAFDMPILTITGSYDGDQPGAFEFYKTHMKLGSEKARANHYLIVGPWDHAGTRTPQASVGGLTFGPASLVDLPKLHVQWYNWAMAGGAKPDFLQKRVAYYVMGAERWRYADTLEGVTAEEKPYFLDSTANANRVMASGSLSPASAGKGSADSYVYDPRDVSGAALEAGLDPSLLTDQTLVLAADGKQLVYHSASFDKPTEVSGFFRLSAWISIDQPDTDFQASVYEITPDGGSILLTNDILRARYRESLREAKLVTSKAPLRYDFNRFTFVSRQIAKGSRLRLVVGPINSINTQKNYNSGGVVADETMADARSVTVKLLHDKVHPSALYIPFGQPE
ncbi:MAG: CocE/NonD family hydrolase [Sphingosinicella sp.]|nr:CocE/NonD family hydrolase [Sphingosinicella sp.]